MSLKMTDLVDEPVRARLYVAVPLGAGGTVPLDDAQWHYLKHVLRLNPGNRVSVFNGSDGEWCALIASLGKNSGSLLVTHQQRPQKAEPDLWLLFAPIKRGRIDYAAEKATELGVSALIPILTRRTIVTRVNHERLAANAREAAEQTERLTVPVVHPARSLHTVLADYPLARPLILCDETGTAPPLPEAVGRLGPNINGWSVMIGPEGGFAEDELDQLRKLPFVIPVGLGPRVLRADTAALAAVALLQALGGDWNCRRDTFS